MATIPHGNLKTYLKGVEYHVKNYRRFESQCLHQEPV